MTKRKSLNNNIYLKYGDKNWRKTLTALLNSRDSKDYFDIDRVINDELFYYILSPILKEMDEKPYFAIKNDVFFMYKYGWGEDNTNNLRFPNFYHRPSGLRIAWYKYPLRGATSNIKLTPKKLRAVLYDCLDSWESLEGFTISRISDSEKWWQRGKKKNGKAKK